MNLIAFLIGMVLPASLGWCVITLAEHRCPLLYRWERFFWALIIGPTLFAFVTFLCAILGIVQLTIAGFLLPNIVLLGLLMGLSIHRGPLDTSTLPRRSPEDGTLHPFLRWLLIALGIWTAIKVGAGIYDLVSVPTYWDDSFNNWNMRGKMFFTTGKLLLEIPVGNGIVQSAGGVSSYPPMLPLLKTWLSLLRGSWQEPLINGLHAVWLIGLIGAFYTLLRRRLSRLWSVGGVWLLLSLPTLLIHATNPYADLFTAAHVFLVAVCLNGIGNARTTDELKGWSRLFGLSLGTAFLTKNEVTLLYGPIVLALLLITLIWKQRSGSIERSTLQKRLVEIGTFLLCTLGPWLLFKWFHGLSFGNAKSVSGMQISFHPMVIQAFWYHLTHEANWLILPIIFPVSLIIGWRSIRFNEMILAAFVLLSIAVQFLIYLFTPLANEAIVQTGTSRGLLHIAPIAIWFMILIWQRIFEEQIQA
jgi:hypothetical protein